jgi:hypothetical protein
LLFAQAYGIFFCCVGMGMTSVAGVHDEACVRRVGGAQEGMPRITAQWFPWLQFASFGKKKSSQFKKPQPSVVEHASKVEVDLGGGLRALHGLRSLDLAVERSGRAVKTTGEEREAVIVQAINGEVRSSASEKIDRSVFKHPGQSQPRSDMKSVGIS